MKYRKKPVVIDAVQWTGSNQAEISDLLGTTPLFVHDGIDIATLEGTMRADRGDWIVRGVKGEFYPVKPEIFDLTYEPAGP